ncbi:segregation and condensation protein A [Phocicoccus pinnipedialis]|uniref:Segregation and condensation protein A n=1 Tax=Phocicoccus pinnipedialis TaxID=110845 RepID=A0A6V7RDJ7_9BACL|nr:segregation/condensation protein A [Jeotgalicoccus pinnipedialis]MBP1939345.1 segregation and condensation protein A [Jeotgalicoccus pinnipedialis]CAD2075769.1 Segregation and condensation protein A [Jeotgalicoccus pinnipedialis]
MKHYTVQLDVFQGPLDLLLHLIKEFEIDIDDIQMSLLTEQYLAYIHKMKELELNIASEYLVMASELLRIKSKMLLPEPAIEESYEDPRDELVSQLLEYQNYKFYADNLKVIKETADKKFIKAPHVFEEREIDENIVIHLNELLEAYEKVKSRVHVEEDVHIYVEREPFTDQDAREFLKNKFRVKKQLSIGELFHFDEPINQVVQVFITLLDLVRLNHFRIDIKSQTDFYIKEIKES